MKKTGIHNFRHLAFLHHNNCSFVWNRFYPSVVKLDPGTAKEVEESIIHDNWNDVFSDDSVEQLHYHRILPGGRSFRESYLDEMHSFIQQSTEEMRSVQKEKKPFHSIQIYNEECNLDCPYCIMRPTWWSRERVKETPDESIMERRVIRLLLQAYKSRESFQAQPFVFSINGGEAMLRANLVLRLIRFIREDRRDQETIISINSNGTTLTEELVRELGRLRVKVFISIDGTRSHHEKTRVFRSSGQGSFDKVIQTAEWLSRYGLEEDRKFFQGTLDQFRLLKPEGWKELERLGYRSGRLAPNLLGKSQSEGCSAADNFFQLCEGTLNEDLEISDSIYNNFKNTIEKGHELIYGAYCNGLGGGKMPTFMYNLNRNIGSYLCQYVTKASAQLDDEPDLYDPRIASSAVAFQEQRVNAMEEHCFSCPVVGLCRGGCIMAGLTAKNDKNPAACAYITQLWKHYLIHVHEKKVQS